ncbi:bifunctional protein FolD [Longispora fulva]|uniref:Bifunctional protein FolD n=1 Tax=Longispora fulva TaxID=619741 RepID=A0A8J7GD44_9ACTN|nr:bifunctional 5,10-methylenetetrahydrofolate dehydrogenase/5,10-methenyltetrahydrofolate cyclohydrolase [Longispora fulva]MBG6135431.1 methylenetetrahydrofolate dehydrogenase (NADP+)/methenyltetrahydrofolate cyclohydrolase [Longispora fulva]GIG56326.1 bifunctional protein FolD [Longispora fulva]
MTGHAAADLTSGGARLPGDGVASPLSGKDLAASIRAEVAAMVAQGPAPKLAIVTATADEASAWYVRSLARAAGKVGITCEVVDLGPHADAATITATLVALGTDPGTHGVILQTPLPAGVSAREVALAIEPARDVDGANPVSLGRLATGLPAYAPATAEAVVALLDHHGIALAGKEVVVVGRSTVVGKPLAHLLLDRDATVTVCHSRTVNLPAVTRRADILVVAVGRAGLVTADHVAPGAVVIDVGTHPTADGGLVGDVDAGSVAAVAGALSPVPGGVGPVTTALLLRHTLDAARA